MVIFLCCPKTVKISNEKTKGDIANGGHIMLLPIISIYDM